MIMAVDFTEDEINEFKFDALEMFDGAERDLLALDRGGDFKVTYDSLFRVFHSLKGAAGMMALVALQEHLHRLESLLVQCKANAGVLLPNINFFLDAVDASRKILNGERVDFSYELPAPTSSEPQPSKVTGKPPVKSAAAAAAESIAPDTINTQIPHVLAYVVDDEKDIVEYVEEVLSFAKVQVKPFLLPEALLAEVKKHPPDVVLTDMMMPKMTGMELFREIRKIDSEIPLIFVSAHLSKKVLLDAIASGVFAAIEKPFQDSTLITQCLAAGRQHQLTRLLNRSMKLLMYQYADLDDFLASTGRHDIRANIRSEIEKLIYLRRQLKSAANEA
jgi:CheY-like chemotaxis protein/HPt (histidine-containing phosphotransfer) domain-containing protein